MMTSYSDVSPVNGFSTNGAVSTITLTVVDQSANPENFEEVGTGIYAPMGEITASREPAIPGPSLRLLGGEEPNRKLFGRCHLGERPELTKLTLGAVDTRISEGQAVSGTGIPANTTVADINGTSLTLSQNTKWAQDGTTTLTFAMTGTDLAVARATATRSVSHAIAEINDQTNVAFTGTDAATLATSLTNALPLVRTRPPPTAPTLTPATPTSRAASPLLYTETVTATADNKVVTLAAANANLSAGQAVTEMESPRPSLSSTGPP